MSEHKDMAYYKAVGVALAEMLRGWGEVKLCTAGAHSASYGMYVFLRVFTDEDSFTAWRSASRAPSSCPPHEILLQGRSTPIQEWIVQEALAGRTVPAIISEYAASL